MADVLSIERMAPVARVTLLDASEQRFCMVRTAHNRSSGISDLPQVRRVSITFDFEARRPLLEGNLVRLQIISIHLVCRGLSNMLAIKRMFSRTVSFWANRGYPLKRECEIYDS